MRDSRGEVWDSIFPKASYRAQPLGMGGSTVQARPAGAGGPAGGQLGGRPTGVALPAERQRRTDMMRAVAAADKGAAAGGMHACPPCPTRRRPTRSPSAWQELAHRIINGGETPDLPPPKLVVLLVGYNNARYKPESDPADKIDWLLQVGRAW